MEKNNTNRHSDCPICDRDSPIFKILSNAELKIVRDNRIIVHFKAGEVIMKQGTQMSHVISVNSGLAKIYLEGESHGNTILRLVKPTNFIGGPGVYLDQLHHYTVSAMKDTSVCFVDMQVFKHLLSQNHDFSVAFMKDFSRNVISVYKRLMSLTQKQLAGRVADAILYLTEDVYENNNIIQVNRQDLADLSAISRDSSAKILREFQNEGIISIKNNELELLKPDTLRMISKIG